MGKPVIGITTYLTRLRGAPGSWRRRSCRRTTCARSSVRAARRSSCRPAQTRKRRSAVVDGLIFSGGSDLDPELYGEAAHPETNGVVRERDDFELGLMQAALERDVPMLAICRGSQVLNVALGGGIEQHVPDRVGNDVHKETPGVFAEHDVDVVPGTRLARSSASAHDVKSHHHQGFGELGEGLRESARAPDGTIEALEDPTRRFALGVLWHPEEGDDARPLRSAGRRSNRVPSREAVTPLSFGQRSARPVSSSNDVTKDATIRPQTMRGGRGVLRSPDATRPADQPDRRTTTSSSRGCLRSRSLFDTHVQHEVFLRHVHAQSTSAAGASSTGA